MLTKHPLCLLSYVGIYQNPDSFFKLPGSIFCKILKAESKPHRIFALPPWVNLFRGGEVYQKFVAIRARSQVPPYPRHRNRTYAHAHKHKKRRKKAPWHTDQRMHRVTTSLWTCVCVYMCDLHTATAAGVLMRYQKVFGVPPTLQAHVCVVARVVLRGSFIRPIRHTNIRQATNQANGDLLFILTHDGRVVAL